MNLIEPLDWPLMRNNIPREDLDILIDFLKGDPILTQSSQVAAFEDEWSRWLGVRHSVFVNSGSSANLLSMAALRIKSPPGDVIVPALTWVSDIAAVLHCGFTPVFTDINPRTLCMDEEQVLASLSGRTRAVFITYAQGFNGLTDRLLNALVERNIPLIEDVCESHGATFKGQRLGSFGWNSNFSFYYAHHMSTIEGGMLCTNDTDAYQTLRMLRSHGLIRENTNLIARRHFEALHPHLNPEFIFAFPAFNVRNTEIGAVLGRSQLRRLDKNIVQRNGNLRLFLDHLDPNIYFTDFDLEGCSNYALNLVLRKADDMLCRRVMDTLRRCQVEFRRGSAGGGNQLRQPYLKGIVPDGEYARFVKVDHIHFYGFYIGNYPELQPDKIKALCDILNRLS